MVPCEENDHDFWLHPDHLDVQVQTTEIVSRDHLIPLSQDEYVNGHHNIMLMAQDQYFGVDIIKKRERIAGPCKDETSKVLFNTGSTSVASGMDRVQRLLSILD